MNQNIKQNAGLYIRVSTDHQAKEGYSIAAQKDNLIKFTKNQDWKIFDIYIDAGISGKNIENRPEVKRLIADIQKGNVDIVVLYKFDRLTRDAKDTEDIIKLIQEFGIQVITLSGGIVDVSTASGRFMVRINGAQAQFEREQIIERVKLGFKQKVKEGFTLASSITCYGYNRKKHEKTQFINKKEAIVVKRIFKMYNDGKSFTEICNILNLEEIPTKMHGKKVKRKGTNDYYVINSMWLPKTIKLILTNPTYIGKVRYHIGKQDYFDVKGNHKPIISEDIWNETQYRINKIKNKIKTNLPKYDVYYCGTLICGICGHKLTTNRTNRIKKDGSKVLYNGYRCVNREKKMCDCIGISHNKVEVAFLSYLDSIDILTELDNINIKYDDDNLEKLDMLKKSHMQINNKRKEVMDLFMMNKITKDQLKYMTCELNKKNEILTNEIIKLETITNSSLNIDKNKIPKTIKEHWYYLNNEEKFEFLNDFVKEIVIINKNSDRRNGIPEILSVKFFDE